ncbi:MAG: tRNA lysidine(34) synthetase TilS [Ilumatobacteraceae bacterium]
MNNADRLGDHPVVAALLPRCTFAPPGTPVVAALSGGADSAAMTALAVAAGCRVTAVHVHHGLRAGADDDAAIAAAIADRLGVGHRVEHIALDDGPNLEARARDARRAVIGTDTMTGHTADDQAETLLLALCRGAGATGLAAIRPAPAHPILRLRRADTVGLCAELGLRVAEDPSNSDPRFRRNRIRHELLPLIDRVAERDVAVLLNRTADLLRDDDDLLDELSRALDPTDAPALASAPAPLARRSIRRWLAGEGYPPDAATVSRVLAVAAGEATGCDVGAGRRVERTQQRLRLSN